MRIVIRLVSEGNYTYDLKYHKKLQGFIYNLLKGTPYEELHDKKGYKFFCFSPILPPKDIKQGNIRTIIISSPSREFINVLSEKIKKLEGKNSGIGELFFKIKEIKILTQKVTNDITIITGSPIVLRIPKANYNKYGIKAEANLIYWNPKKGDSFEPFVKQLEENIIKKYKKSHRLEGKGAENLEKMALPLFQEFEFIDSKCNHLLIDGIERKVFGSLWRFNFQNLNETQKRVLQFGLDAGFGERNTLGFGFVNVDRNKDSYMQKGAIPKGTAG